MNPKLRLAIAIGVTALGVTMALVGLVAIAIAFWPAALMIVGVGLALLGALKVDIPNQSKE